MTRIFAATLLVIVVAFTAHAFPDRPLTLITPYPANGYPDLDGTSRVSRLLKTMQKYSSPPLTDSLAQEVAQLLSGELSQPVGFERRGNGNALATAEAIAAAKPDGHTLLFAGNQTITLLPSLYPHSTFDPRTDLAPVATIASMPMVLITRKVGSALDIKALIARARMAPGRLNYAAIGDGSTAQLAGRLFQARNGIDVVHLNYNGSLPAINAVILAEVAFGVVPLPAVLPSLPGGLVRVLAIAAPARHPAIPDVPSLRESGLSGLDAAGWFGVFAPVGTPKAIASTLNQSIRVVMGYDFIESGLIKRGLGPLRGTVDDFRALIERDNARALELRALAARSL